MCDSDTAAAAPPPPPPAKRPSIAGGVRRPPPVKRAPAAASKQRPSDKSRTHTHPYQPLNDIPASPPPPPAPNPRDTVAKRGARVRVASDTAIADKNLIVIGSRNKITGVDMIVYGSTNAVEGSRVVVFGNDNSVVGDEAIIRGSYNTVRGNGAQIMGRNNTAEGNGNMCVDSPVSPEDLIPPEEVLRLIGPDVPSDLLAPPTPAPAPAPVAAPTVVVPPPAETAAQEMAKGGHDVGSDIFDILSQFHLVAATPGGTITVYTRETADTHRKRKRAPAASARRSKKHKHGKDEEDDDVPDFLLTEFGPDEPAPDAKPEDACCICQVNKKRLMAQECHHLCMCNECARHIVDNHAETPPKCPVCRTPITKRLMKAYY